MSENWTPPSDLIPPGAGWAKSVLILCTSREKLPVGNGDKKLGGLWMEELATPFFILERARSLDNRIDITVASVKGGKIPVDPNSLAVGWNRPDCTTFLDMREDTKKLIEESVPLKDVIDKEFAAILLPGGYGAVYDLNTDPDVISFLEKQWAAGKVIAAVGHGVAALIKPRKPNGDPIVKGMKVTGFKNSEEADPVGYINEVPFLLEDALKEQGGIYSAGPDWRSYAISDDNNHLITGQSNNSSAEVAKLILKALNGTEFLATLELLGKEYSTIYR